MAFDRKLLHHFIRDALAPYSEDFSVAGRGNPVRLSLNGVRYSARVSYVHDSGNMRDNEDEIRIQIRRNIIDRQRGYDEDGIRAAFIGFFDSGQAFVAWDPRHVFSLRAKAVSVYARQSQYEAVFENHAAIHAFRPKYLGEDSFAIALPANALGFYLENIGRFHDLSNEDTIVRLMKELNEAFTDAGFGKRDEIDVQDDGRQERFEYTRKAYPRDPRFKKRVLDAYTRTCCVCDRQLGIIEAAHIIPHSVEGSPNDVTNGLALCVEHHRLYDQALLLPGPDKKLIFNPDRAEYLRQTNRQKGLDGIEAKHGTEYSIPEAEAHRPSNEYLEKGLAIRMGE